MKTFLGYTWVGWLNILLFQWFFFRLAFVIDGDANRIGWLTIKWVWPLTGWKSNYKFIGGEKGETRLKEQAQELTHPKKTYTKEAVQELMDKKEFWKQFDGFDCDDGVTLGKLRRSSLIEVAGAFSAKVVDEERTPKDAFHVDGSFRLTPEQIDGFPDPLGLIIIAAARQALKQLFRYGGSSDFARFADCTKLQIYDPDPEDGMSVRIVLQFHIWYASTVDGFEPRRAN